ncbi:neuropeptide FF receptor 2 isoform X3 [Cryptotermes secundus]|uniref:neuropeptide FF receptor 2 isoform X3 n=1 Tax=Cryptotermes secundus TaxID=105785 RepID=UPI001454C4F8|nr:neuropeptide FF receptor 2 isoform X3 [Cryptotermes secundus]
MKGPARVAILCLLCCSRVSVGASVFTITAMSIDRYLAIRHPMAFRKIFNRTTTLFVIVILWIVALSIFAPVIWVRQVEMIDIGEPNLNLPGFCIEKWPDNQERLVYGVLCFVFVYAIPGSVVVLAYSLMGLRLCAISPPFDGPGNEGMASTRQCTRLVRERRRVARILLLLAVLFAFCWLPYNVLALLFDLGVNKNIKLFSFALLLGHANSAINPILYCFMTRNFRRAVRELVLCSRVSLATRPHQRCNSASSKRHHIKRLRFLPQSAPAVLHAAYTPESCSHKREPSDPPRSATCSHNSFHQPAAEPSPQRTRHSRFTAAGADATVLPPSLPLQSPPANHCVLRQGDQFHTCYGACRQQSLSLSSHMGCNQIFSKQEIKRRNQGLSTV